MKNTTAIKITLSIVFLLSLMLACKNKNTKKIDVSSIQYSLDIERFDKDFFEVDTNHLLKGLESLQLKDSIFFDFYINHVMRFGNLRDSLADKTLVDIRKFLTNKYVRGLNDTVQKHYSTLAPFDKELSLAVKHFMYYFPKYKVPKFKTIISEFSYNVVALDTSYIAISLDMYLGKNYMYYPSVQLPYYIIKKLEPEYIVPNVTEVLYNSYYYNNPLEDTEALIYAMIEKGKMLYFKECLQPKKDKYALIGYTPNEYKWCEANVKNIWQFYNEHDLFYSKDYMEHNKALGEGPTTQGMPKESPSNVGSFIGWQIVNKYMLEMQNKVSLPEFLETPSDVILSKSKYKP